MGQWHCTECEPSPALHYLRGATLEALGSRPITLELPTGDPGSAGSWARAPVGKTVELVLYESSDTEVLARYLDGERLAWFRPGPLKWEIDWWSGT